MNPSKSSHFSGWWRKVSLHGGQLWQEGYFVYTSPIPSCTRAPLSGMLPTSRPFCPLPEVTQTDMKPVLSSLTENSKGAQGGVHLLLLPRLWGGQPWIQGLEEGPDIRTPHLQPNLRTGHNVSWKKRLAAQHVFRNVRQTFTRKKKSLQSEPQESTELFILQSCYLWETQQKPQQVLLPLPHWTSSWIWSSLWKSQLKSYSLPF